MTYPHFELWYLRQGGGIISKARDKSDHQGFAPPGAVRGWARIERRAVVLFRTDKAERTPSNVAVCYQQRFPRRTVEDRSDLLSRLALRGFVPGVAARSSGQSNTTPESGGAQ